MLINLRNALMAGKRTPTAKDYVQNGLVVMWDGIENAGWGVHDASATTWQDLIGTRDLMIDTTYQTIGTNCVDFINSATGCKLASEISDVNSIEFCGTTSKTSEQAIFRAALGIGSYSYFTVWYYRGAFGSGSFMKGYNYDVNTPITIYSAKSGNDDSTFVATAKNGIVTTPDGVTNSYNRSGDYGFGFRTQYTYSGRTFCVRVYSRALTAEEIAANYAIDKARFNLP